jgi:hypothetical protein
MVQVVHRFFDAAVEFGAWTGTPPELVRPGRSPGACASTRTGLRVVGRSSDTRFRKPVQGFLLGLVNAR